MTYALGSRAWGYAQKVAILMVRCKDELEQQRPEMAAVS
jgi:hypothetical protein